MGSLRPQPNEECCTIDAKGCSSLIPRTWQDEATHKACCSHRQPAPLPVLPQAAPSDKVGLPLHIPTARTRSPLLQLLLLLLPCHGLAHLQQHDHVGTWL